MPLYRVTNDRLEPVGQASFIEGRLLERTDRQRLLKSDISVIGDDMVVTNEAFGDCRTVCCT